MNLFTWDLLSLLLVTTTPPLAAALAAAHLLRANAGLAHVALLGGLALALLLPVGVVTPQLLNTNALYIGIPGNWPQLVDALLLLGGFLMLLRLAVSCLLGMRLLRRAEPMAGDSLYPILKEAGRGRRPLPVLFATRDVKSPAIWCWGLRPALLIPDGAATHRNAAIWRGVFEHELAHVRRRDNVSTLFCEFALCLLYWHPLAHLVRRQLFEFADIACDEYAAHQLGDRTVYAEALLSFAVQPRSVSALSLVSNADALKRRIHRLLSDEAGTSRVGLTRGIAAAALLLTGFGGALYAAPDTPQRAPESRLEGNLIQNAGFEKEEHWKPGSPIEGVTQQLIREGDTVISSYYHFNKTVARYFPIASVSQEVAVQIPPGTTHVEVGAHVRCEELTKAVIDVEFEDADGNWSHAWAVYLGPKEASEAAWTHDWKSYSGQVALPPGTRKVTLSLQQYGPGQVDFDDVSLHFLIIEKSQGDLKI
jgi:beta-lactamase regulating signal transducer with metallopeptidase domain